MSKNILIGVVAFGGIAIVSSLLFGQEGEVGNLEQGSQAEVEAVLQIPADVAGQFPIYPNTGLENVRDTEGETSRDVSLSLSTKDSITDINDWYRNALSAGGWSIKSDKNIAGYQIIQGENGNLYTSMQAANGTNDGEVLISQSLKVRKE